MGNDCDSGVLQCAEKLLMDHADKLEEDGFTVTARTIKNMPRGVITIIIQECVSVYREAEKLVRSR